MRKIVYVGNFSFPFGDAAGKRVYANACLLREIGYEVIIIGMDKMVESSVALENTKQDYEGFIHYSFPYPSKTVHWLQYNKRLIEFINLIKKERIINELDLVIYYGSPAISLFNTKLINFCKKNSIKIVSDCVDWLTIKTNNMFFDIIKWLDNTYQKGIVNKRTDGVIAISSYLSKYYLHNNCKTVVIPPLSTVNSREFNLDYNQNNARIFIYAGMPFRKGQVVVDRNKLKDRIDKTILLFSELKQEGFEFIFNIYGFTKEEYLHAIPNHKDIIQNLNENVFFHGHKPNKEIVEYVRRSDFSILIRDVNRDTTAGFPSKISESISLGTPVITTKTSDLSEYIIQGENGFFIENKYTQNTLSIFKEIFNMDRANIVEMKKKCINSNVFYYQNFIKRMTKFLEKDLNL